MNRSSTRSPCAARTGTTAGKPWPLIVNPPSVSFEIQRYSRSYCVCGCGGSTMNAPEQPASDLVRRVVVRVVHERAGVVGRELVGVLLAGHDRLLRHERDAVLEEVVELDAVEVDAGRLLQVVREDRADLVALVDAQRRARPLAVVAEGLDRWQQLVDRVLDLVDREAEHLRVAVELGRHRREGVGQDEVRDLRERRLLLELRVVVLDAEDVGELGHDGRRIDVTEHRDEVAEVAPDAVPGGDVVLGPARRNVRRAAGPGRRRVPSNARRRGSSPGLRRPSGSRSAAAAFGSPERPGLNVQTGAAAGAHAAMDAAARPPPVSAAARRKPRRDSESGIGAGWSGWRCDGGRGRLVGTHGAILPSEAGCRK